MYSIRAANPEDYSVLPSMEQAAGLTYLQTRYKDLADGPNVSEHIAVDDRVWVATCAAAVVGFVIAKVFADVVHIHELDVHPQFARLGHGRALITHVAHWARYRRSTALTLTTFSDVRWNAPYYKRLGFALIETPMPPGHLKTILEAEANTGLDMTHRVAMRMTL